MEEEKITEEVKVEKEEKNIQNVETTEKVENDGLDNKTNNQKPKKKHKILKLILVLIILLILLFIVHTFRNYMVISELIEKQKNIYGKENNYSFVVEHYSSYDINDRTHLEYYHKDGKRVMISEGTGIIWWGDEATKETIVMTPKNLQATVISENDSVLKIHLPKLQGEDNFAIRMCFIYFISTDEVNGKECYKLQWGESTTWVEKETGLILKSINGKTTVVNGKEYDSITEWDNYKLNKLTEQDVTRPNLLGYDVTIQE